MTGLVTLCGWYSPLSYNSIGYIYLLGVIALSRHISRWPALAAAVLSAACWNYFFEPPRLSFSDLHFEGILLLVTYFAVALAAGQLTSLRTEADRAKILGESERMHQALLDSVSHELKTPVAVFRAAVEQLGTNDPGKRELLVGELRIATERLDNLVGNPLNQTRLESGVLRPKMDWCDSRDLVDAARRAVGSRLEDHPLTIDIPFDFRILLADAALMEQAIAHLLLNAAVHTPAGTPVVVNAGHDPDSNLVFISVADGGPGVPAELHRRIFEKFGRDPGSRSSGLGLGLSIVRGFMLAQGGDVSVDSAPNGGARFRLFLPEVSHEGVPAG